MAVISKENAGHYYWGQRCEGWHLLAGDDLSVIEECMRPGSDEQRHRHVRARHFFYVLEGEAVLELDGTRHHLRRGEALHVPPGTGHQLHNVSMADVRLLVVSAPKSHGDRTPAPLAEGAP